MAGVRIGVPAGGRLREDAVALLGAAGCPATGLRGREAVVRAGTLEMIEMRPRDAAAALAAGTLAGAFVATDLVMEHGLGDLVRLPLGCARSTLVVAVRDDADIAELGELHRRVVATHLPVATSAFLAEADVDAQVLSMGGSLEGLCAAGLADAIVDNTETGTSLHQNALRVLASIADCEAEFVHRGGHTELADLELRLSAVVRARGHRYVMLHAPAGRVGELATLFPGLAAPTVLPLTGRRDLVAVHFVVETSQFWSRLSTLRAMGATGIVALHPDALVP